MRTDRNWEAIISAMIAILGVAVTYGALTNRVSVLEDDGKDGRQFKQDMIREVTSIHTELHALMDRLHVPHDRSSGDE